MGLATHLSAKDRNEKGSELVPRESSAEAGRESAERGNLGRAAKMLLLGAFEEEEVETVEASAKGINVSCELGGAWRRGRSEPLSAEQLLHSLTSWLARPERSMKMRRDDLGVIE